MRVEMRRDEARWGGCTSAQPGVQPARAFSRLGGCACAEGGGGLGGGDGFAVSVRVRPATAFMVGSSISSGLNWSAAAPGKHPCAIRPKAVRAMKRLAPRSGRSSIGGTTRTAVAASEGTGHSCVKALHHWCESVVLTVTLVVMAVDVSSSGTSQTLTSMLSQGGAIRMPILLTWRPAADCSTIELRVRGGGAVKFLGTSACAAPSYSMDRRFDSGERTRRASVDAQCTSLKPPELKSRLSAFGGASPSALFGSSLEPNLRNKMRVPVRARISVWVLPGANVPAGEQQAGRSKSAEHEKQGQRLRSRLREIT